MTTPAYHSHCLGVLMADLGLSNRGLAMMVEPHDEGKMNALRQRIIAWRKGTRMTDESADRILPALSEAAGRTLTREDLLTLEEEVPAVEAQLATLLGLVEEIRDEQKHLEELVRELQREVDGHDSQRASRGGKPRARRAR